MTTSIKSAPAPVAMSNSDDDLLAQVAALRAENARLKDAIPHKAAPPVTCKVTEKGGMSVYGLGRFPVTLYKSQWERLMAHKEQIEKFLADNEASLKTKE